MGKLLWMRSSPPCLSETTAESPVLSFVCLFVCVSDKEAGFGTRRRRATGSFPHKWWAGALMGTAEASSAVLSTCLCVYPSVYRAAVCLSIHSMDQTWKLGQPLIHRVLQRGERRVREPGTSIWIFGRWWGNVGHAYLRKRCRREGSVVAGAHLLSDWWQSSETERLLTSKQDWFSHSYLLIRLSSSISP